MALSKLTKKRVGKVIEALEALPPSANRRFTMEAWFAHEKKKSDKHNHGLKEGIEIKPEHYEQCGTSACAIGWAARTPYFKKLGLSIVVASGDEVSNLSIGGITGIDIWSEHGLPKLFGLSIRETSDLFGSHNKDRTAKQWVKRAKAWLKERA